MDSTLFWAGVVFLLPVLCVTIGTFYAGRVLAFAFLFWLARTLCALYASHAKLRRESRNR